MRVLTQNISWEAMTGANTATVHGQKCLQDGINLCAQNVFNVLAEPWDILCIQENIFDDLPNAVHATEGRETISIVYNPELQTLQGSFSGNLDPRDPGRPFLLCMFETLVVINVHAGHFGNGRTVFSTIETMLRDARPEWILSMQQKPILVAGDFNMAMPSEVVFFGKPLRKSPNLISCCDSQLGTDYNAASDPLQRGPTRQNQPTRYRYVETFDHIQISPTLSFQTVSIAQGLGPTKNLLHSDHLPIEATIL